MIVIVIVVFLLNFGLVLLLPVEWEPANVGGIASV